MKSWLLGKDSDAGKDQRQEAKGTTEVEMVWWHHQLDGHESEQVLWVGNGQGSFGCCSPWGCKESDITEQLNWLKKKTVGKKQWQRIRKLCGHTKIPNIHVIGVPEREESKVHKIYLKRVFLKISWILWKPLVYILMIKETQRTPNGGKKNPVEKSMPWHLHN